MKQLNVDASFEEDLRLLCLIAEVEIVEERLLRVHVPVVDHLEVETALDNDKPVCTARAILARAAENRVSWSRARRSLSSFVLIAHK